MKRAQTAIALLTALLGVGGGAASAQQYPAKQVTFVVGFAPGGANDTVARIVAQKLSEAWPQGVLVVNRPGAGGTIAADQVTKAPPDGHTLFVGEFGTIATAGSLYLKLPYDPGRDFAHVTQMTAFPLVLVVPAASPLAGLKDLIEQARATPGALKYSSPGVGNSPHLFIELMNRRAGISTLHVPYKGGAPALVGLMTGDVEYSMMAVSTARSSLTAGKIRALGVTSAEATPTLPGVPPIASVLPGYEGLNFHGLHAPADTPKTIVVRLQQDVAKVLRRPEVTERLAGLAMDVSASTPEEYAAFVKKEIDVWGAVIRAAHIRAE